MKTSLRSLALPVAAAAALLLAGCGQKPPASPETPTAAAAAGAAGSVDTGEEKVLNVYNWSDYIAPDTLANFETAFYRPMLSDWRTFEAWHEDGARTATERANGIWKQLLAEHRPPPLEADRAEALDAFVARDTALARHVREQDDAVDALKEQLFRELLTFMMADPKTIPRAIRLILISRFLERVADHATNIAEMVIYMVESKMVRHSLA